MKRTTCRILLALLAPLVFNLPPSPAQTAPQQEGADQKLSTVPAKKGQKYLDQELVKREEVGRKNEPHNVMARAYLQTIATYARALGDHAQASRQLSADFARALVVEINRSLDKAEEHQRDHLKTIPVETRLKLAVRMKETEARRSRLHLAVDALEKDVQSYTLDPKEIAAASALILTRLEELAENSGDR